MPDQTSHKPVMLITGTRKGIGNYLANYYLNKGFIVIGCSRGELDLKSENYIHYCLDVADENKVKNIFRDLKRDFGRLDVLINNAGIASMNHSMLTPLSTVKKIFDTNVTGTFLFSREAAKIMRKSTGGRIVNLTSVAVPLKLAGEAIYAASKAAVNNLTQILAAEFADFGITVNAIGATPLRTDLIKNVPEEKIAKLISKLSIKRLGEFEDVVNAVEFFIKPESNYITGQILYFGGV
ncbi:MAG: 3-oxoacyl-[acyl-carrier-protein] reductase [Segetibacter sp.]|nr:3-oxoacyl-[acyl-carrier-protein] reductase [Segetibacter sp.]